MRRAGILPRWCFRVWFAAAEEPDVGPRLAGLADGFAGRPHPPEYVANAVAIIKDAAKPVGTGRASSGADHPCSVEDRTTTPSGGAREAPPPVPQF